MLHDLRRYSAALQIFAVQRLLQTCYTTSQCIDRLFKLPYIFVGINASGNVLVGMTKYTFNGNLISAFVIKIGSSGVATLVRGVFAICGNHNLSKPARKASV